MPNRWIKEAYCSSSRINSASAEARDLWVRLLVRADDHGYFHGDAQLVASACFPLQPNARKCEQLLSSLEGKKLIVRYESGGKQYLALTQWYERPRSKPKHPEPPPDVGERLRALANNCEQLQASTPCNHDHDHDHSYVPNEKISFSTEVGWTGIGDSTITGWGEAYPAINIPRELAKAREWLKANPKNGKANWRRFLIGWLSRAQDRAPRVKENSSGGASSEVAL